MVDLVKSFFKVRWLNKPVSLLFVFLGSYFVFDGLKEISWTFFLFLNQNSFSKYMMNYDGPFKFFQQLKNDNMIYVSFREIAVFLLPVLIVFGIMYWVKSILKKIKNPNAIRLISLANTEYKGLIWVNFLVILFFASSFVRFSKDQYVRSVNEFIQFKVWMVEHDRAIDSGCVYYPELRNTFYYNLDSFDFVSHFSGYSLSPLEVSLKDVLNITSSTAVSFDESLCDSNNVDLNKSYSGSEVIKLMNEYSESCGKKNLIRDLKLNAPNAPIRVTKKGAKNIVMINYKPFAVAEFKCSKDPMELMDFRSLKILNGD